MKVVVNKDNHNVLLRLPISGYQQMGLYVFSRRCYGFPRILEKMNLIRRLRCLNCWEWYPVLMVEVEDEGLSVDTPNDVKLVELRTEMKLRKRIESYLFFN